jgi:putative glycosyltransferase (TIGR04348 family)
MAEVVSALVCGYARVVHRRNLVIVTPALADANNGNWQTARRWARFLSRAYRVRITDAWHAGDEDLLLALHARRSAPSIAAWAEASPRRPAIVVLTGTDLYRDIDHDPAARRSLDLGDALVTLNALGPSRLSPAWRAKAHVVMQSCAARRPGPRAAGHLKAVVVGHLRDEKDPLTVMRAMRRLADRLDIRLDHLGRALDPALGAAAEALAREQRNYRWLGGVPHGEARRRIAAAHVLVHASRMEGGAHAVIEAVRSGIPVIASRIDGNLGLLGDDYAATFEPGDDAGLAALLRRARDDPDMLRGLTAQCDRRAPLFAPEAEAAALHTLVAGLLARDPPGDRP